ncbi:MAG: GntR family transcriptional regulator [Phycisphaeraceae bacterium]
MPDTEDTLQFTLETDSARPLYLQLRDRIIGDIRRGRYKAGSAIPSISALEAATNASRVTVIRALTRLTEDGFIFPQHGKGYYVAERGQKTLLAVVAPFDLRGVHYSSRLLAGVELAGQSLGFDIMETPCGTTEPEFESAVQQAVFERGARRLVVVPPVDSLEAAGRFLGQLRGAHRLVVADRGLAGHFPSLRQDRTAGYWLLAGHLKDIGARRVATVGFASDFEEDLPLHGVLRQAGLMVVAPDVPHADALDSFDGIDAVCCADDYIAARIHLARRDASGRAPFALTGCNRTAHGHVVPGGLTTIDPGLVEMGRLAATMLAEDLDSDSTRDVLVAPQLVIGASTQQYASR